MHIASHLSRPLDAIQPGATALMRTCNVEAGRRKGRGQMQKESLKIGLKSAGHALVPIQETLYVCKSSIRV
jgi:hypothetical protein